MLIKTGDKNAVPVMPQRCQKTKYFRSFGLYSPSEGGVGKRRRFKPKIWLLNVEKTNTPTIPPTTVNPSDSKNLNSICTAKKGASRNLKVLIKITSSALRYWSGDTTKKV